MIFTSHIFIADLMQFVQLKLYTWFNRLRVPLLLYRFRRNTYIFLTINITLVGSAYSQSHLQRIDIFFRFVSSRRLNQLK